MSTRSSYSLTGFVMKLSHIYVRNQNPDNQNPENHNPGNQNPEKIKKVLWLSWNFWQLSGHSTVKPKYRSRAPRRFKKLYKSSIFNKSTKIDPFAFFTDMYCFSILKDFTCKLIKVALSYHLCDSRNDLHKKWTIIPNPKIPKNTTLNFEIIRKNG